jgi:glycerol-3-phosphate dehydrogenase
MLSTPATGTCSGRYKAYGRHARELEQLAEDNPALDDPLCDDLPYTKAQCVWAIRHEMARTIEDVLGRRTRALFLNARSAREAAPAVLEILTQELNLDAASGRRQLASFERQARTYDRQRT